MIRKFKQFRKMCLENYTRPGPRHLNSNLLLVPLPTFSQGDQLLDLHSEKSSQALNGTPYISHLSQYLRKMHGSSPFDIFLKRRVCLAYLLGEIKLHVLDYRLLQQ